MDQGPVTPAGRGLSVIADQAWLMMMTTAFFWASNVVLGRAVAHLPPLGLNFWRWLLAAILVLPFAWPHLRKDLDALVRAWPIVILVALLGVAVFNTLVYVAVQTIGAINVVTLQTSIPVAIVAATFFIYRERVTARQAVGIGFSMLGALTLISHGDVNVILQLRISRGDLWLLAAIVGYAISVALLRQTPKVHPFSFLFATFGLAAAMLLPAYLVEAFLGHPMPASGVAIGTVVYTAIFPSIVAWLAFNRAVALVGPNVSGLTVYMVPVFGVILSALVLGELPQLYHAFGIPLIVTGIVLATRKKLRPAA